LNYIINVAWQILSAFLVKKIRKLSKHILCSLFIDGELTSITSMIPRHSPAVTPRLGCHENDRNKAVYPATGQIMVNAQTDYYHYMAVYPATV
jgi:hypothetical protein